MSDFKIKSVLSLEDFVAVMPEKESNAWAIFQKASPIYVFESEKDGDMKSKREQAERILNWLKEKEQA